MTSFLLSIRTPEKLYLSVAADVLILPGQDGERSILANELSEVVLLKEGVLSYSKDGRKSSFYVGEGAFSFDHEKNEATVLVSFVLSPGDFRLSDLAKKESELARSLDAEEDPARKALLQKELLRTRTLESLSGTQG